jgi:predicted AlkP superfamily phosphohydrolase/phosphomutase
MQEIDSIRGHTFWDRASIAGKKVCILNPFLAYPAWPVNGVMISGPIKGPQTSYPPSLVREHEIPELGGIEHFPSKVGLDKILIHSKTTTRELVQFGVSLMKEKEWDLFFISLLTLDRIEHFFWRFHRSFIARH